MKNKLFFISFLCIGLLYNISLNSKTHHKYKKGPWNRHEKRRMINDPVIAICATLSRKGEFPSVSEKSPRRVRK